MGMERRYPGSWPNHYHLLALKIFSQHSKRDLGGKERIWFIDNYCTFRSKLKSVLEGNITAYLDLFQSVQRVSTKIPKKHHYQQAGVNERSSLVFRDPTDQRPVRTKVTPPPYILQQQLFHFHHKWKDLLYNDKYILPPLAIKEIKCLLLHIRRGCISGILPGHGMNRKDY